jgi:F-type H+-transporting ATPase subunit gamma
MPSLKDLRVRIASVKATQKITKAMQMVAAAKLRKAQTAAESARPFAERMDKVILSLGSALKDAPDAPRLLRGMGSDKVQLLVVCTAERGLCGAFNPSIARLAREKANALMAQGHEVKMLCVGKKGADALRRTHASRIVDIIEFRGVKNIGYVNADQVGKRIRAMFEAGEFDVATLFYSRFKSVIAQIPTAQQIVPAPIPADAKVESGGATYEYEPDEAAILEDILPRNISVQVFRALLENAASEQGARMSAMDNATRNAGDMIKKLTLNYNKSRQAMITKELIEIVSGAEAL